MSHDTHDSVMARMHESWHTCMSHGTREWVMAHVNELWHTWMGHGLCGTLEWGVCVYVCVCANMCVRVCVCVCVCVCTRACTCVCACLCVWERKSRRETAWDVGVHANTQDLESKALALPHPLAFSHTYSCMRTCTHTYGWQKGGVRA